MDTKWISYYFFFFAGLVHIGFFFFEAVLIRRTETARRLGLTDDAHAQVKIWAINQGFYNLMLALGTFLGLWLVRQKQVMLAGLLTSFCGITMIVAGVVLFVTAPRLRKWALLQALPPLLGFLFLVSHVRPE